MSLQECYKELDGAFEDVCQRLFSEALVTKFVIKFLDDKSFMQLCNSIETSDYSKAFIAAHTMKGICQNLSFTRLHESSHNLTEALRNDNPDADLVNELFMKVKSDYQITANAIQKLKNEK